MRARTVFAPVGAVALLAESSRRAKRHSVSPREERIFRAFNDAPDAIHVPAWAVMQAGSLAAVFVAAAELTRREQIREAATTFATGFVVWLGVKLVKPMIGRGRPHMHLDDVSVRGQAQTGLGFPSGHAAVSLTLALLATQDSSATVRAGALGVAATTAGARMYVGAHLPLDVVGGVAIGVLAVHAAEEITSNLW